MQRRRSTASPGLPNRCFADARPGSQCRSCRSSVASPAGSGRGRELHRRSRGVASGSWGSGARRESRAGLPNHCSGWACWRRVCGSRRTAVRGAVCRSGAGGCRESTGWNSKAACRSDSAWLACSSVARGAASTPAAARGANSASTGNSAADAGPSSRSVAATTASIAGAGRARHSVAGPRGPAPHWAAATTRGHHWGAAKRTATANSAMVWGSGVGRRVLHSEGRRARSPRWRATGAKSSWGRAGFGSRARRSARRIPRRSALP